MVRKSFLWGLSLLKTRVTSALVTPALRARSFTLIWLYWGLAAVPEPHGVGEAGHRGPAAPGAGAQGLDARQQIAKFVI